MIQNDGRYNLSGVHGVNRYLWHCLSTELGMKKEDTGGLEPIMPTQQLPLMTKYPSPFLIYNWITDDQGLDWWNHRDVLIYKVYSEEEVEIRQIGNLMRRRFEEHDTAAQVVNEYLRTRTYTSAKEKSKYDAFHYKYIKVGAESGGIEPAGTEGGRQVGTIVLNIMYTVDYDAIQV